MDKRVELLNSVADQLVKYLNESFKGGEMKVKGLTFHTQEDRQTGKLEYYADFDFGYSPAGEDLGENTIFFNGTLKDLQEQLDNYTLDVDEYVEMWLEAKRNGVSGVPSASELVRDAEIQKDFRESLSPYMDGFKETLPAKLRKTLNTIPNQKAASR